MFFNAHKIPEYYTIKNNNTSINCKTTGRATSKENYKYTYALNHNYWHKKEHTHSPKLLLIRAQNKRDQPSYLYD